MANGEPGPLSASRAEHGERASKDALGKLTRRRVPSILLGPMVASLLATTLLALELGVQDTIRPVTITTQIIGVLILATG